MIYTGDVNSGIQHYLKYGSERAGNILQHAIYPPNNRIEIERIEINNSPLDEISLGNENYKLNVSISGLVKKETRITLEARLHDSSGGPIATFSPAHFMDKKLETYKHGPFTISGKILLPVLTKGLFYLSIFLTDPGICGLCDLPLCLSISSSSMPLVTFGSTLSVKDGHGMLILNGDFEVIQ